LTRFASFNIKLDIVLDTWPPVVAEEQFQGLELTGMSSKGCIMVFFDDIMAKGLVDRDVDAVLVGIGSG
jgi:hypothetical protein